MKDFVAIGPMEYINNSRILNPRSRKIHHCHMTPIDKGQRLKVRDYIGLGPVETCGNAFLNNRRNLHA